MKKGLFSAMDKMAAEYRKETARLQEIIEGLTARVAAQSELLSQRSERGRKMQGEQMLELEIDGARAPKGEYALRWNDDHGRRDLYRDGRRVTKPWRVVVQLTNPGDPLGGNANTDG